MPDLRSPMKIIEQKLGEIKAADRIEEDLWYRVLMRELSNLSKSFAAELGRETGCLWDKRTYKLELDEAPPTRLLSLTILLSAWLGWIFQEKESRIDSPFNPDRCLETIVSAFEYGRELSRRGERP